MPSTTAKSTWTVSACLAAGSAQRGIGSARQRQRASAADDSAASTNPMASHRTRGCTVPEGASPRPACRGRFPPRALAPRPRLTHPTGTMPGTARGGARLRTTLGVVTGGITAFALALCAALVVLTTHLHRTSDRLADAVESVRLAEEIEIDLLLHARARDASVRRTLRRDIMQRLA